MRAIKIEKTWNNVESSQEWPAYQNNDSSRKSQKNSNEHLRNHRPRLPQLMSVFMIPSWERDEIIWYSWDNCKAKTTKRNIKARYTFAKNTLRTPKPFGIMFCGLKSQKWNLEGMGLDTSGVKITQHSTISTSYQHKQAGGQRVWQPLTHGYLIFLFS